MSDLLFGRTYRLQIDDLEIDPRIEADLGLRVTFRVERSTDKEHNKAEVEVYNLGQKTRDRLTNHNVTMKFEAGYQNQLGLVFTGNIIPSGVSHIKQGPDWVSKFQAGDGENGLRTSRVNESFGPNTRLTHVIEKLAGKFQGVSVDKAKARIKKGDFSGAFKEFAGGFNAAGELRTEFDRTMKTAGLTWSIQNGELQLLEEDETTQELAFEVGPGSGLIGSPERGDVNSKTGKGAIKFRSLLNAAIAPGRRVVLKSRSINATLKIFHTVYVGDSAGGDSWFTEAEGHAV